MPHMNGLRKNMTGSVSLLAALLLTLVSTGCHTSITPLQPALIGPPWALPMSKTSLAAGTRPAAGTSTIPAAAGATRKATPGNRPRAGTDTRWFANFRNGSTRTVRIARYQHIWRQSVHLIRNLGYNINWQDHRLGIISTDPRLAPEVLQWWRPDTTNGSSLMESTLNTYRRIIRLVITQAKTPESYHITVEVLVQRRENPQGDVGNVAFVGPSAFGSNILPLKASHAGVHTGGQFWMTIGRDTLLEKKILKLLFKKI